MKTKTTYPVHFTLSGITLELEEGAYLLDSALDAGIEMESSCREGACGACATLAEGEVEWATEDHCLSSEQLAQGYILTCICKVKGELSLEE